jgi:hypothetical protein
MFYTNESALVRFTADLRAFVSSPSCELTVRRVRGSDGEVMSVDVRWRLDAVTPQTQSRAKPFSMRAPITYAGIDGIADSLEQIELRDADGAVGLVIKNDEPDPGGYPYYRVRLHRLPS